MAEEKEKKTTTSTKTTTKAPAKKPASKTATAKKTAVKKEEPTKKTTKKVEIKETSKKTTKKAPVKKVIDPRTGQVVVAGKKETPKKTEVKVEVVQPVEPKKTKKKTALPKKSSKELTIEVPKKEPAVLVRPTPKKQKELNKEEKVLYKQLCEAFDFVLNLGNVIEDRTMDRKQIPDLALGELHVIETVNKNNNKPMTLIAKKEHVTVGALTTCVNRLVQKGYLLRTRDEMDQRVILLSVTQKAKKVLKVHDKFHDDIIGLALEGVNLAQAAKVMSQFAHILEVYYDPSLLEEKEPAKKTKKKK